MASNEVIGGDYQGCKISSGCIFLSGKWLKERFDSIKARGVKPSFEDRTIPLNKDYVASVNEDAESSRKNYHLLTVNFYDGKASLIAVDDKTCTKIIGDCFAPPGYTPNPTHGSDAIFAQMAAQAAMNGMGPAGAGAAGPNGATGVAGAAGVNGAYMNPNQFQPKKKRHVLCRIIGLMLFALIAFCFISAIIDTVKKDSAEAAAKAETAKEEAKKQEPKEIDPRSKIEDSALEPIPKTSKVYKTFGAKWIQRINDSKLDVALYIVKDQKCDKLYSIEISDNRSITKGKNKRPILFADCVNNRRYYIDIDNMTEPAKSVQQIVDEYSTTDLTQDCIERGRNVFRQLAQKMALKAESSMWGSQTWKTDFGDKMFVLVPWTVTNAFNMEQEYKIRCVYDDRGFRDADLLEGNNIN